MQITVLGSKDVTGAQDSIAQTEESSGEVSLSHLSAIDPLLLLLTSKAQLHQMQWTAYWAICLTMPPEGTGLEVFFLDCLPVSPAANG